MQLFNFEETLEPSSFHSVQPTPLQQVLRPPEVGVRTNSVPYSWIHHCRYRSQFPVAYITKINRLLVLRPLCAITLTSALHLPWPRTILPPANGFSLSTSVIGHRGQEKILQNNSRGFLEKRKHQQSMSSIAETYMCRWLFTPGQVALLSDVHITGRPTYRLKRDIWFVSQILEK